MDPISIALGLAQIAPSIAKWFGNDEATKVAETVAGIAKTVSGKPTGKEALQALEADSELALEFRQMVLEQEAGLEAAYLEDRQSARRRDVELAKTGRTNRRADILAVVAVLGLVSLIVALLFVDLPEGAARDILLVLAGALVAIVKDVYAFEFGSSRGSKDKDDILGQLGIGGQGRG